MEPETVEALRIFARVLTLERRKFVLIGATVPQIVLDLRNASGPGSRETRDVDAIAEVNSWEDFTRLRECLLNEGFRPGRVVHELSFHEEVRIDLLPFGPGLIQNDKIVWPDGYMINAFGLREALECSRDQKVAPDLTLPVVTIPGLVLTKIIAYMDRPEERARDMVDMLYCFERYEERGENSRRFDCVHTQVDGEEITFEDAGAFLLGVEVASLAKPNSLEIVRRFLAAVPNQFARPIAQILSEEKRLVDNEKRRRTLYRLFRVFGAGVNPMG
jgi:predicted nucleotidyltransferase